MGITGRRKGLNRRRWVTVQYKPRVESGLEAVFVTLVVVINVTLEKG